MTRPLGSAHRGTVEWLIQRLTSVYIGAFALFVFARLAVMPVIDYGAWRAFWTSGGMRLAASLFLFATLVHAWTGMRSVYLDYVKAWLPRFAIAAFTAVFLLALGLYGLQALWSTP